MSTIKLAELRIIDRVMGMEGGYVLDFSDRTFAQFFDQEMGVDIDNEVWHGNGTSKAKRLRAMTPKRRRCCAPLMTTG